MLTANGTGMLSLMLKHEPVDESLTRSMVTDTGAKFLDAHWEQWWSVEGINLCMEETDGSTGVAYLDELWTEFAQGTAEE